MPFASSRVSRAVSSSKSRVWSRRPSLAPLPAPDEVFVDEVLEPFVAAVIEDLEHFPELERADLRGGTTVGRESDGGAQRSETG
jgi:hypothetical protein